MPEKQFDPIPTRHSLLNRLKDWGDQTSWQDFFDTCWQLIYNVAVKAGLSDAEAQEVVQETVIAVARKIGEFNKCSTGTCDRSCRCRRRRARYRRAWRRCTWPSTASRGW